MKKKSNTRKLNMPIKPSDKSALGKNDYQYISDLLQEMKTQIYFMKSDMDRYLATTFGINSSAVSDSVIIHKKDIPSMSDEDLRRFLVNHELKSGTYENADRETLVKVMTEIKDSFLSLAKSEKEYSKGLKIANEATEEYYKFQHSIRMEEARDQRLKDMKTLSESIEDELEKKKCINKIDIIEKTYNYTFLLDRFNENPDKEVERVCSVYFDANKGSYMITRYEDKITKIGFSANLYKNFFNIEETFLPEEYHPFNNLFLFYYMYWGSHIDTYNEKDSLYAKAITGAIANLIYHKFATPEKEKEFIELIKKIDDYFMKLKSYFEEENSTYKNNPKRIAEKKAADTEAHQLFEKKFKELGILDRYDPNAKVEVLKEIITSTLDNLIEEQLKEEEELEKETNTELDERVSESKENISKLEESLKDGIDTLKEKEEKLLEEGKKEIEAAQTDKKEE